MKYEPSVKSWLACVLYALWPLATGAAGIYFLGGPGKWWLWVLGGFMALLSLYLLVQAVFVHCQVVWIDEIGIRTVGPLARAAIRWSDVTSAVLRERRNAVSRTDRMVVIQSGHDMLVFHPSILSYRDEEEVLKAVRARTRLVEQRDAPSV